MARARTCTNFDPNRTFILLSKFTKVFNFLFKMAKLTRIKEKRVSLIELHKFGHNLGEICRLLKKSRIDRRLVNRTIKRFKETREMKDPSRSGHPRRVRTPKAINAARARIHWNPSSNKYHGQGD